MRLLVTGANGQVGRELRRALTPLGTVLASCRDGLLHDGTAGFALDLDRPEQLPTRLDTLRPDVVVNAAAWTAVDEAETHPAQAHRINSQAVGVLARWAAAHGVPMVHYSTDYVFNGQGRRPWREDDATAPLGAYGASKLAGEEELAASGARHLLLRTAWVYAAHGHNFLHTMLRLAAERDTLQVVDDQHGTPTPASLVADVSAACLRQWLTAEGAHARRLEGTWHLVAGGQTTWYGFADAIMRRAVTHGLLTRAPTLTPVSSAQFPRPARRPAFSVLDTHRLQAAFGITLPPWQDELECIIGQLAVKNG